MFFDHCAKIYSHSFLHFVVQLYFYDYRAKAKTTESIFVGESESIYIDSDEKGELFY